MEDLAHDLAALMCSKLCHDLISPIGALANGIEVLEDETDASLREHALELIAASARSAAAKLQFARLAFGTAGGRGGTLDLGMAARAASEYIGTTKTRLHWEPGQEAEPKDIVRLCLNLLLVGLDCIPRGGVLTAKFESIGEGNFFFTLRAAGQGARVPEAAWQAVQGDVDLAELDARLVQPFFTGYLARLLGAELSIGLKDADILVTAGHGS